MPEIKALARFRLAGRMTLLLLVAGGILWMVLHRNSLDAEAIARTIATVPAAPLFFLLAQLVASLIFFPRTVLAVAAGAVFGFWMGTLWAALGSVVGAMAGFLLARYVNDGLVDLESMRRFGPILLRAERGGWRAVAVLRLVPVIPHSLSNYALGLTRLDLGAYALGSLLGQLPMTIACVDFGAAGETLASGKAGWIEPTLVGLAVLVLSVAVPRMAGLRHRAAVSHPTSSQRGDGG
jgi:uncharacterized membrane protein YdjX (TVP38/TMEM64 family)